MGGDKQCKTNLTAEWGQMSTGGGHKPLAETVATLGVPTMNKQSFVDTEKKIIEWLRDPFEQSMISAAREERDIAIDNN